MEEYGEILVTPERLLEKAKELETLMTKAEKAYGEIAEIAESTKSCFQGKSAEKIRKAIKKKKEKGELVLENVKKYPLKLQEIAKEYDAAERGNKNVSIGN